MGGAVTFDFHNTLAFCDAWFELEVRHLPSAFLRWQGERRGARPEPELLDRADAAYTRLRDAIKSHGDEQAAETGIQTVLVELGVDTDPAEVATGVAALMRETLDEARPMPGAIATVRALAGEGIPLGIISSAVYHPFLEWTLAKFGVRDAFLDVTTSASAGFYKSRPELFWHAAAALGAAPEATVHVGDSYRFDVTGARRAGMKTIWLRGDGAREDDAREPAALVLNSLEDAAPQILTLLRQAPR